MADVVFGGTVGRHNFKQGGTQVDRLYLGENVVWVNEVSISFLNFPDQADYVISGIPGDSITQSRTVSWTISPDSGDGFREAPTISPAMENFSYGVSGRTTGGASSSFGNVNTRRALLSVTCNLTAFPLNSISIDYNDLVISAPGEPIYTVSQSIGSLSGVPSGGFNCNGVAVCFTTAAANYNNVTSSSSQHFGGTRYIGTIGHTSNCGTRITGSSISNVSGGIGISGSNLDFGVNGLTGNVSVSYNKSYTTTSTSASVSVTDNGSCTSGVGPRTLRADWTISGESGNYSSFGHYCRICPNGNFGSTFSFNIFVGSGTFSSALPCNDQTDTFGNPCPGEDSASGTIGISFGDQRSEITVSCDCTGFH